jgi:hypothetical protein
MLFAHRALRTPAYFCVGFGSGEIVSSEQAGNACCQLAVDLFAGVQPVVESGNASGVRIVEKIGQGFGYMS